MAKKKKSFLESYQSFKNQRHRGKPETLARKEQESSLKYTSNPDNQDKVNQYHSARKQMGLSHDDTLTKKKYDSMFGNEKTGDTGIFGRFNSYQSKKNKPINKPTPSGVGSFNKEKKENSLLKGIKKFGSEADRAKERIVNVMTFGLGKKAEEMEQEFFQDEAKKEGKKYKKKDSFNERKGIGKGADIASDLVGYLGVGGAVQKGLKGTKLAANLGKNKLKNVGQLAKEGAATGAIISALETPMKKINDKESNKDTLKRIALETGLGAVADPLVHGVGKGIGKLLNKGKTKELNKVTKTLIKRTNNKGKITNPKVVQPQELNEVTKSLIKRTNNKGKITNPIKKPIEVEQKPFDYDAEKQQLEMIRAADRDDYIKRNQQEIDLIKSIREGEYRRQLEQEMEFDSHVEMANQFKHIQDQHGRRLDIDYNREEFGPLLPNALKAAKGKSKGRDDIYKVADEMGFENVEDFIHHYKQAFESHKIVKAGKNKFVTQQLSGDPDDVIDELYGQTESFRNLQKSFDDLELRKTQTPGNDDFINQLLEQGKKEEVLHADPMPKGLNPEEAPLIKVANAQAKPVPNQYDSVKHINDQISREVKPEPKKPIGQRVKDFANRVYYNMFDDAYGLARLDKARGKSVRDADSAVAMAHRSRGSGAKTQQELEQGFYDANGQKVGLGFSEILQRSKNPDQLENYLVAKGIIDYDSKGMVALKTDGLNQLEMSNRATKQLEAENPDIVREAQEFYDYLKNQRNILAEGGILNAEQIKQMEEANPNYVPMERVHDEGIENFVPGKEGLRKRLVNVGNPVKKRTGSERQIISPFETTVKRQYIYNNMADRNKAGMAVLNHLRELPEDNPFGTIIDMEENAAFKVMKDADEIANRTDKEIPEEINKMFHEKDGDNNIVYVYENGNKYKIQVKDKMLFDSVMSLDSKSLPVWMNALNMPVKMLRAGVTLSPDFAVRNFLRDQLTTGVTSQKGYIPFYDALKGAFEIIKGRKGNSEFINAYTRNGADMGLLQNIDRTNTIKSVQELKGNVPLMQKLKKLRDDPSLLLEPLRKMGEISEKATRIGHMKRSVKKGDSFEQAAYNARSTMDFNRAGAWGRQINQGVAFFNASLQGMDVLARSFKDQPARTAKNIGLYVVAPTYALYMANKDQQWFKDLPEQDRDRNWFINLGDEILKIPKPFEVGIMFGAGLERGLDKHYNGEGGEYDGYIKELAGAFTPEIIPTAVKPLLEVYTNKNFFTGNAIDSMGDEMLPAKDRYNAYNSQFSIKAADLLSKVKPDTEISPKDIDNLVRGYTGTLGTTIAETSDKVIGAVNPNVPKKPNSGLQTTPFIRSLMVRNLEGNNKPTNDFYDLFEEMRSMKKTQGEKFKYPTQKKVIEKTYRDISDIQKAKKEVLNSTKLNGKEKAKQIKKLNEDITKMARKANELKPR